MRVQEPGYTTIQKEGYKILVFCGIDPMDPDDDNLDVEVQFDAGDRYVATLFTIENLKTLMARYEKSGECDSGSYFWASDMVIIRTMTFEAIEKLIEKLIEDGEFTRAFTKLPELDDDENRFAK